VASRTFEVPQFELSDHARRQLSARKIDLLWLVGVLARPARIETDRRDPTLRHALGRIPENGNRVLRVVYNHTVAPWRIVTVYFDRGMRDKL
jgi:hypothetical protein